MLALLISLALGQAEGADIHRNVASLTCTGGLRFLILAPFVKLTFPTSSHHIPPATASLSLEVVRHDRTLVQGQLIKP